MTLIKRTNNLFPTFFDDFFGRGFENFNKDPWGTSTVPAVNIKEENNAFHVEVAAPGIDKKDFKVELDDDLLTISYEKEHSTEEKGDYTKKEFSYQSFKRSFNLPKTVENTKIQANYKDGILHLMIPKKDEAKQKPSRLIEIS